jgi:alpha-beta hydrolase superfamily lysophospholipase
VHGTADGIAYAKGSEQFASKVTSEHELKLYDGLYHETHNEPEKATVLADIVAWLDAHVT